jgi:hypothetical protein
MLFATLDPTTRRYKHVYIYKCKYIIYIVYLYIYIYIYRVRLPKNKVDKSEKNDGDNQEIEYNQDTIIEVNEMNVRNKGQEVLLTDTVGFISKLPTDLIVAFRATLEEVKKADILIHVIDRASPVYEKQRETVLRELDNIGCSTTPIVELWNKVTSVIFIFSQLYYFGRLIISRSIRFTSILHYSIVKSMSSSSSDRRNGGS